VSTASDGHVAVVGLGLIGGSLARLLASRGVAVVGTDTSATTRGSARTAGLEVAADVGSAVTGARIVVLAVPLRAMRAVAVDVARHVGADATVTDVGSVKGSVRRALAAAGLGKQYVGAHPMAGTEHSGFGASDPKLLDGAAWAVTVAPGTDPDRLAAVLRLVTGPLRGTAAVLTDDVHDEVTALVSHVPHVVATQLLNAVAGAPVRDAALGLAAGSFRDGTRVALTDPARTEAMVTQNAGWVASALRKVVRDLEAVLDALETNAPVAEFFHASDDVRASWPPGENSTPSGENVRVPLAGDWPPELVDRCTAGAVVVGLTDGEAELRSPR
jgi:prephenate dehydrogenase